MRTCLWMLCVIAASACSGDPAYQATASPDDVGTDVAPDVGLAEDTAPAPEVGTDAPPDLPVIEPDGGGTEPACSLEDSLAPNQSADEAAAIESDIIEDYFLCGGTSDWYSFEAQAGQTLVVWTSFNPRQGDIDIYLYSDPNVSEGDHIAESSSPNRPEYLEYDVTVSGRFLLEVRSFEGAEMPYTQIIKVQCQNDDDCPAGRACHLRNRWCYPDPRELSCGVDDGYEPNESAATATPVALDEEVTTLEDIAICPEDEDYYRVEIGPSQGVVVEMSHSEDVDIDVLLFKDNGDLVSEGQQQRGGETLRGLYLEEGDYLVMVDMRSYQGAGPAQYSLAMSVTEGRCEEDSDCDGLPQREFCNVETGVCFGIDSDGGQGLFETCDDDDDCADDTDGCYEGTPGAGDNLCTVVCNTAEDECGALQEGAYCLELDRLTDFGVCVPPCTQDLDCSRNLYCDTDTGRCASRACGTDADCLRDGEVCLYSDLDWEGGLCLENTVPDADCGVGEAPDDGDNGTSGSAALLTLDGGALYVEGMAICDEDADWYVVALEGDANNLTVDVGFEGQADLDVYLYNEDGREMGRGIEPNANPEQALTEYVPAGRYYIRVNGYPVEDGDEEVAYTMQLNVGEADCRNLEGACDDTSPLRLTCNADNGACDDFDGQGAVELGGFCDTLDDCNEDADICLNFFGAQGGQNICTHTCQRGSDCNDIPNTRCQPIRRGLGVCVGERQ